MTCEQAADLIGPYVDDDLPSATRRRVEAHLLGCAACAWDAETLRITRARLREEASGEVVASDAFRARALARLHADNPHVADKETVAADPAQYQLPIRI
jgi:anti-sigma factor RsiW